MTEDQMWSKINAIATDVAVIKANLMERCERRMADIQEAQRLIAELDARVDALERFKAQVLMLAALGSIFGGGVVSLLVRWLGGM